MKPSIISGLAPLINADARCLVLGSIPGNISLVQNQYYAHSRNVFWKIASELLGFSLGLPYQQRLECLSAARIGLWDVLSDCERNTSLDSDIVSKSVVSNDFNQALVRCAEIKTIYFNGAKAEQLFQKHVSPTLMPNLQKIKLVRLPSTSPAYAAMCYQKKREHWQVVYK